MKRPRRLEWGVPEAPPTKHPYRDTLIVYAGLATVVVLFAWITGGAVGKAALVAVGFFVLASSWSLYRWRALLRAESRRSAEEEGELER
jgi:hypothetical protein